MLEIKGIDVFHGDLQALRNVSLPVADREIVTVVGSNGAGKSTLLRSITGLLRPAAGEITFNGLDLTKEPVHKIVEHGIGMVPDERKVFGEMSVLENLEMGAFCREARQVRQATLSRMYEIFPVLESRKGQRAGTLSGGEQKMLLIARALMSRPKLLLIDELSLGLAPLLVQNLFRVLRQLYESTEIAIVLVEQNVRAALELADRGYVIENGELVVEGKAQDLLNSEGIKDAYFGVAIKVSAVPETGARVLAAGRAEEAD
jgi:branched-chain amino acid transport system ATP-binding protein